MLDELSATMVSSERLSILLIQPVLLLLLVEPVEVWVEMEVMVVPELVLSVELEVLDEPVVLVVLPNEEVSQDTISVLSEISRILSRHLLFSEVQLELDESEVLEECLEISQVLQERLLEMDELVESVELSIWEVSSEITLEFSPMFPLLGVSLQMRESEIRMERVLLEVLVEPVVRAVMVISELHDTMVVLLVPDEPVELDELFI